MTDSDIAGVYKRLDSLSVRLSEIKRDITRIQNRCAPCSELVKMHQEAIDGNGKDGIRTKVTRLETGRVDTITVPSICKLVAAFGAALAMVIGAMAAFN